MAVYKVAQDVEADDKLLGPFTARQFIYLIIVALSGLVAWFLSQLFLDQSLYSTYLNMTYIRLKLFNP